MRPVQISLWQSVDRDQGRGLSQGWPSQWADGKSTRMMTMCYKLGLLSMIVFVPVILAFLIRVTLKIKLRSREVCVY